jgi:hypothetical protein
LNFSYELSFSLSSFSFPQVAAVTTHPSAASSSSSSSSPAELTAVVDSLLDALTRKFSTVSAEIFSKIKFLR